MTYIDTIDTRELDEELTTLEERDIDEPTDDFDRVLDDDELERLKALRELRDEIGEEWRYGVTLIPKDDFEDYARELAEDVGAIPSDYSWPTSHIDWTAAADALRMDYTTTDFDGVTYLYRA
jgi:DNA-binding transcriptional ArsR family regulator